MPTSFYDAVVIGTELAALGAGALLARRGLRVLWAGGGDPGEVYATAGDLALAREPFVFAGLDRPPVRRVLDELSLAHAVRRRLSPQRPAFQVVLPRARIDVAEIDVLHRELDREFAGEREAVQAALAAIAEVDHRLDALVGHDGAIPPQGFWQRRELARLRIDPRREPDPTAAVSARLRALPRAVAAAACDALPDTIAPCLAARLYSTWRRGTARVAEGRSAIAELLRERIESHAGELRPAWDIERIVVRRGRVSGVIPRGQKDPIGCQLVIAGVPPDRLLERLADRPRALAAAADPARVAGRRYVVHYVLPAEALPEGMAGIVVAAFDVAAPMIADNVLVLTAGEADPEGRVVLTAQALAPAAADPRELRPRIDARVAEVVPFLDEHLLVAHSPHDGVAPRGRGDARALRPSAARLPMSPVYAMDGAALGLGVLPYRTGVKNLFLVGRGSLPALGLEGEFAAAWSLAHLIAPAARKRDLLKKAKLLGGSEE